MTTYSILGAIGGRDGEGEETNREMRERMREGARRRERSREQVRRQGDWRELEEGLKREARNLVGTDGKERTERERRRGKEVLRGEKKRQNVNLTSS